MVNWASNNWNTYLFPPKIKSLCNSELIYIMRNLECKPSGEYRLWGNQSALTDNGQWLATRVAMLEGKKWQINPDHGKLKSDCKL